MEGFPLICSAHLEERQSKIQREVVDAKHGVTFVMVGVQLASYLSLVTSGEEYC